MLDADGLIPGVGEPVDLINAIISLTRGDTTGAGLSVAAMFPVGGQAATAVKVGRRGAKSAANYEKHARKLNEAKAALEELRKQLCEAKGPKRQKPIQDAIDKLLKDIAGHEKEIGQKWPGQ